MRKPPKITDQIQIGKTPEGEPIWIEPKDLLNTPEEDAELQHNTNKSAEAALIDKAAMIVLDKAALFAEETVCKTANKTFMGQVISVPSPSALGLILGAGYEVIQEGLKTVVKYKGKVMRTMIAEVTPMYREMVAKRVDEIVRSGHA